METINWTADMESCLFYAMMDHKPVGENKHFNMIFIYEKYNNLCEKKLSSEQLWQHLNTLYDLQALNDTEMVPFPNDETEFSLPDNEFENVKKPFVESKTEKIEPVAAVVVVKPKTEPTPVKRPVGRPRTVDVEDTETDTRDSEQTVDASKKDVSVASSNDTSNASKNNLDTSKANLTLNAENEDSNSSDAIVDTSSSVVKTPKTEPRKRGNPGRQSLSKKAAATATIKSTPSTPAATTATPSAGTTSSTKKRRT